MSLSAALYERLSGDAELAGLLPAFHGGPALFTALPVPAAAPLPLLAIGRPEQESNLDVQDVRLARLGLALTAFARQEAPAEELEAPLRRARRLLEGADLAWPGGELAALTCRGPLAAPAERPWRAARLEVEGLYFPQPEGGSTP
ncbi:tail completion protein gp17 [Fodinicurvata sediminis]|uniref:tail completion protein gp17 n=1 Tax=Fodinicurvata sediminis TaxID=1121832 RepID=UPI0003B3D4F7|nr:DUF3168 domain-containing protein [Fodinicurvata sediminis]